ncbi:MAG: hypothetical protein R3E87_10240 [Burkholderiaceae bacterium]
MTRIVFGLMSAADRVDTIDQLAESLLPARVIVHQDHHRLARRHFDAPNVHLVPNPGATGRESRDPAGGVLRMLEHALEHFQFDLLITLAPTCLPIRPLAELVDYLEGHPADAYTDLVMLDDDPEALAEFAAEMFYPAGSLRQRAMLKLRDFALSSGFDRIGRQGLSIARPKRRDWRWRAGQHLARAALEGKTAGHPFGPALRPAVGAPWFGATRPVLERMLEIGRDGRMLAHYRRCRSVDENFFATVIANMHCRVEPMLHFTDDPDPSGRAHDLDASGLARARASGKFFAHRFGDDPRDPVRLAALAAIERDHVRSRAGRMPATMSAMLAEITRSVDARHALRHVDTGAESVTN